MILTTVLPYGRVALGPDAEDVGFVEGALIQIVVLSTGSVLIRLDDTPPLEVPYRRQLGVRELKRLADRSP